jgi:hypothetical protein
MVPQDMQCHESTSQKEYQWEKNLVIIVYEQNNNPFGV